MFRKRNADPGPTHHQTSGPAKGPPAPELPRRRLDLPTAPGGSPPASPPPQVNVAAAPRPERGGVAPAREHDEAAGKRLIVGRGIRLSGEITACDRLVVEGEVEATLNDTRVLEITPTGRFIGGCEVEEAEIGGAFDGELTVRRRLLVRATGEITGTIRYGELEVERGARLTGIVGVIGAELPGAALGAALDAGAEPLALPVEIRRASPDLAASSRRPDEETSEAEAAGSDHAVSKVAAG